MWILQGVGIRKSYKQGGGLENKDTISPTLSIKYFLITTMIDAYENM